MSTPAAPSGSRGAGAYVLPLYTLTLFLSAFLLFAVQPMFTKMVLPMLGGSAAVWNTAVVFFQATLLLGYLYAHLSTRLLGLRRQTFLHVAVLLVAFTALPIGVAVDWTPPTSGFIPWLIGLLAVSIGLPFFAVSATAPLLQKWFAHTDHPAAGDPYFLYGGSNLGSLAALLSYPVLIEPTLGLRGQGVAWTIGYGLLVAAIATCAVILLRRFRPVDASVEAQSAAPAEQGLIRDITWRLRGKWLLLSIAPSALLLGVTLHIGTDIAAVPFLWVIPLSLYLLTFVLAFARRPLVARKWWLRGQILFVVLLAVLFQAPTLYVLLCLHIGVLFFTAMVCHGELARQRPVAAHLTEFYLWMSIGGVVGGFLAGIAAPLVFDGVYEYPLALLLALLLRPVPEQPGWLSTAFARWTRLDQLGGARARRWALDVALPVLAWGLLASGRWWAATVQGVTWLVTHFPSAEFEFITGVAFRSSIALVLACLATRPLRFALGFLAVFWVLSPDVLGRSPNRLMRERSFFGVYSVTAEDTEYGRYHILWNGAIDHGAQNRNQPMRPVSYYFREGPIGQFMEIVNASPARRIGVIGLGVGVLACYLKPEQRLTYYEIDALDERIARDPRYFSYLSDAGAKADVVIGDGRLSLAKEQDGAFDVIVVAAFSGDAIPVHLLTREAFALYMRKLSDQGLLLFNITNAYLELMPVVARLAADAGMPARARFSRGMANVPFDGAPGDWVVVARRKELLAPFERVTPPWSALAPDDGVDLWTDDFTDIVQVLRWKELGQAQSQ